MFDITEEWSHMSQKVSQAIKEKMDMLAQLNKVQSEEMTIKVCIFLLVLL